VSGIGTGRTIGIVASDFNAVITDGLLEGAVTALEERGVDEVIVVHVPGALELPLAAKELLGRVDGVVAVGAVILGETDHYHHVATQAMQGLSTVALQSGKPVANAVLTVRRFEQARERAVPGPGGKGYEAAAALLATLETLAQVKAL
jgi:6,7-dimethyl-8-ribityllumazine synthase